VIIAETNNASNQTLGKEHFKQTEKHKVRWFGG
jgi:hypothetical protein